MVMLKRFDFLCEKCEAVFEDLVEGHKGEPDMCAECGSLEGFKKLPSIMNRPTTIVPSYPGSKRFKAGYVHTHADRPAEKAGHQISMAGTRKVD
jgi:hypothetical protein